MVKSRAEIQREYRQRVKEKNNAEYLRKERDRKNRNYVPSSSLSENDRKERNRRNKQNLRRYYQKKRAERARNETQETSGYESGEQGPSNERGRMLVRMDFSNRVSGRRKGALKRWKRDKSLATSRVRMLEQEREKLIRKYRSTQRSLQRIKQRLNRGQADAEMTPNKQTEKEMRDANLDKIQREKLKKSLLFGNVLTKEIKETKKATPMSKLKALHRVVSGKIVKKYKLFKHLSNKTGLCRHQLSKSNTKNHQIRTSRRSSRIQKYKSEVVEFLKREDNSRTQPGKNDAKSVKKGERVQVHILTDYLHNLFNKFRSENPDTKMSLSSFCRCRPKYIYKTAFTSRLSCLCTKHTNAALAVKAARRAGIDLPLNPERVAKNMPTNESMKTILSETIPISQWTRVEVEEKGKKKSVTRIVETIMNKEKFISHFDTQMVDFDEHVTRVNTQYEQIRLLKQNLPPHEMIIQVDFAENYSCRSLEEVQSAYFNQTAVTLHPMVAYWKSETGELNHQSFITVSDEMAHKASTVVTFIDDIIPELKKIDDQLNTIHYWSDSPSSQYRNKYIFDFISNHECVYRCSARWNYFESGHGKGPCDGLGGTCKRLADEAIRCGKVIIQDAQGFYDWTKQSSMKNVSFRFVSQTRCKEQENIIAKKVLKPVKGTMKIHAVIGQGSSKILTRDISCYCENCLRGNMCDTWRAAKTQDCMNVEGENEHTDIEPHQCTAEITSDTEKVAEESYEIGDYVAAVYDNTWFVGKVHDKDENEIEIDFMEKKKQLFQWPSQKDIIWLKHVDVLCKLEPPVATGKTRRMFKLGDGVVDLILQKFEK